MNYIRFNKNKEENGYMSNMYPSTITYNGKQWRTAEHFFQALRFKNLSIQAKIRNEKSPMYAKKVAKKFIDEIYIKQFSKEDVQLIDFVVQLKFEQNIDLQEKLLNSGYGETYIYEDVSARIGNPTSSSLFWGGYLLNDEHFIGMNILGKILMKYRFCKMNGIPLNYYSVNDIMKKPMYEFL